MMIFNQEGMNKGSFFWKCAALAVVGYLVLGFVTMLLWNWLVPSIFNLRAINYAESLGLLALSKILLWGFHKKHNHYAGPNPYWKEQFQHKLSKLDPAEREAFKQKMKEKWCRWEQQHQQEKTSND
jgi:hypothetical protein